MELSNGIILLEEIRAIPPVFNMIFILLLLAGCISFVIGALLIFMHIGKNSKKATAGAVLFVCSIIFIVVSVFATSKDDPFNLAEPTDTYRVVITSETNIQEFQNTFDIIDYDGGVYTVKPKE